MGHRSPPRIPRPWASIRTVATDTPLPSIRRGGSPDLRLIAALLLCLWVAGAAAETLFGYRAAPAATLAGLPQWRDLVERIDLERDTYPRCGGGCDTLRGQLWSTYLAGGREERGEAVGVPLLWRINAFVNTFPRRPRGTPWRTPLAFLDGGGDAFEAAVMKYATLRELGIGEQALQLVLGRDLLTDLPHPLLAVTLACISHQPPTADADPPAVTGRAPSRLLNIAPTMPSSPSSPRAPSQRGLGALATEAGEKCRLDSQRLILDTRSDSVVSDGKLPYYQPELSFNARGRTLYLPPEVTP
ncbi:hypothetical protein [Endothiovibrio diazotrophicus]